MAQATDIVLDGAGYMLLPGKSAYTRTQDGMAEGRTGRIQIKDFFGGQRRPYQLERDKVWDGLSVGPAHFGQAVEPWPHVDTASLPSGSATPAYTERVPWTLINDYLYIGRSNRLYRTTNALGGSWDGFTLCKGQTNPISGMCYYAGGLLMAFDDDADIGFVPQADYPTFPNAPTTLLTGERGGSIVAYAGFALWNDRKSGAIPSDVRMVHGSGVESRYLDNAIVKLVTAENQVLAITRAGIYSFTGRVKNVLIPNPAYSAPGDDTSIPGFEWSGDFEPFFQQGNLTDWDDYRFVLGFGGRIYAWYGKRVMEFNPLGERAGWRDTGLSGQQCDGACVAGGYLLVCIKTHRSRSQLWAWDGSGWWKVLDRTDFENNRLHNPIPLHGAGDYDAMVFQHNTMEYLLIRLNRREYPTHTIPGSSPQGSTAYVTSPLIDCNERDKNKAWRKVGAVFASPGPESNSSTDEVTVKLEYSTNNGESWTEAASTSLNGNTFARNNFTLDADIASAAAVSRWLQLRITWSSLSNWAPLLCGLWAEFETLDAPARRRKWNVTIQADDELIDRSSAQLGKTGRELIADLWDSWESGSTVTFRDIDYDSDSTERNVRIVGISESTERPSDHGQWGHATVKLTLVEV